MWMVHFKGWRKKKLQRRSDCGSTDYDADVNEKSISFLRHIHLPEVFAVSWHLHQKFRTWAIGQLFC